MILLFCSRKVIYDLDEKIWHKVMTSYDRYQQQLYENWLVEIILDIINFLLQLSPSVLAGPSAPNNPPPPPQHTHI